MVHASIAAGGEGLECRPACAGTSHSSSLALEMNVTEKHSEVQGHPIQHANCLLLGKFPLLKCDDLSTGWKVT